MFIGVQGFKRRRDGTWIFPYFQIEDIILILFSKIEDISRLVFSVKILLIIRSYFGFNKWNLKLEKVFHNNEKYA